MGIWYFPRTPWHFSRLYDYLRLNINFFQLGMNLQRNPLHGTMVHKVYNTAQTPYQRLL